MKTGPNFRTTVGVGFTPLIGKTPFTAGETLSVAITGAADGEFGVFTLAPTGETTVTAAAGLTKDTRMFVGYMREGKLIRTSDFLAKNMTVTSSPYRAPVVGTTVTTLGTGSVVGQMLDVKVIQRVDGVYPFPQWNYSIRIATTIQAAIASLQTAVNAGRQEELFTITAITATTFTITAKDSSLSFDTIVNVTPTKQNPVDSYITVATVKTAGDQGSGTMDHVLAFMNEGYVREGNATIYMDNEHGTQAAWGAPSIAAMGFTSASTFATVVIKVQKFDLAKTPEVLEPSEFTAFVFVPPANLAAFLAILAVA